MPSRQGPQNMAGKPDFDPEDPVQVAVKVTQLENAILGAQRDFSATAQSLGGSVDGLRTDVKAMVASLNELASLNRDTHAAQTQHNNDLGRAFSTIKDLREATTGRLDDAEEDLEVWKRRYEEERDRWRSAHEEDNRKTRERMILWSGLASGISLLATTLVLVLLFIYNSDKQSADRDRGRIETEARTNAARIEAKLDARTDADAAAIREMERYLTQEGTISNRPYTPKR